VSGFSRTGAARPLVLQTVPGNREFRTNDRFDPGGDRGFVKPRRAVDAVTIEQRDRGILEFRCAINEEFRERGALEKTEGGRSVEFDVGGHDRRSRQNTKSTNTEDTEVNRGHGFLSL